MALLIEPFEMLLHRCPICNKPNCRIQTGKDDGKDTYKVYCPSCGLSSTTFDDPKWAVEYWNNRNME